MADNIGTFYTILAGGKVIPYNGAKIGANGTATSGNEGELSVAERSNSRP